MRLYVDMVNEKLKELLGTQVNYKVVEYGERYLVGTEEKREVKAVNIIDYGKPIIKVYFDDNGNVEKGHAYKDIYKISLLRQIEFYSKLLHRRYELTKAGKQAYAEAMALYEKYGELI